MVGRIEDYAIVGETRDGAVRVTGVAPGRPESPGMSAEACQAKEHPDGQAMKNQTAR